MTAAPVPADAPAVLEAREVSVRFGGLQALSSVSLAVPPGTTVGILGPNGAGKTTLFNALTGFVRPASGSILYRGGDVTRHPPERRARAGLVRTFQRLQIFEHLSIYENVLVGFHLRKPLRAVDDILPTRRGAAARERLRGEAFELLDRVGLGEFATHRPADVPFGVLRRVEIARALAARPRVLLLDEPASGLALAEREALGALLADGLGDDPDLSVVLVEHDVDMVMRLASYVFVLDFGQLIAEGTPEEIGRSAVVREAYLGGAG